MLMKNKVKAVKMVKSYGQLTLSSTDIPGVKDLKLGDKQTMTIEVDVVELRKPDHWEISEEHAKPTDVKARVNILKVTTVSKEVNK